MAAIDDAIDALYALPPDQFTDARNDLAKSLKGDDAKRVRALKKPSGVPWAVNQLYWKDRRTFSKVMELGKALRKAQVAALEGKKADVRESAAAHREAVSAASARAAELAGTAKVTAKSDAVARMLEAVSLAREQPADVGRFTEVLQPAAFDALAGVSPKVVLREAKKHDSRDAKRREDESREAREHAAAALEAAEQTARRADEALIFAKKRLKAAEDAAKDAGEALADARKRLADLKK